MNVGAQLNKIPPDYKLEFYQGIFYKLRINRKMFLKKL